MAVKMIFGLHFNPKINEGCLAGDTVLEIKIC